MLSLPRRRDKRRRRLLFLVPHVPGFEAPSGGARSPSRLIADLSVEHDVAVLCLRRPQDPGPDERLRRSCAIYEEIEQRPRGNRYFDRVRRRLFISSAPTWVRATDVTAFRER